MVGAAGYGVALAIPAAPDPSEESTLLPEYGFAERMRRNAIVRSLLFNPVNLLGVIIVLLVFFLAIAGPAITPYSPIVPDYNNMLTGPSSAHYFGTDSIGDDIFSRVLAGARLSITTAIGILAIAVAIGLTLGAIAGLAGGWVDEIIMRLTDMFLAFPALILALVIAASLGPGLVSDRAGIQLAG